MTKRKQMTIAEANAFLTSRIAAMLEQYEATGEEEVIMDEVIFDAHHDLCIEYPYDNYVIGEAKQTHLDEYFR